MPSENPNICYHADFDPFRQHHSHVLEWYLITFRGPEAIPSKLSETGTTIFHFTLAFLFFRGGWLFILLFIYLLRSKKIATYPIEIFCNYLITRHSHSWSNYKLNISKNGHVVLRLDNKVASVRTRSGIWGTSLFYFPEEPRGSEVPSGGVLFNTPHGVYSFNIKLCYGARRSEASASYPVGLLCGVNTKDTLQRTTLFFTFPSRVISFFALPK